MTQEATRKINDAFLSPHDRGRQSFYNVSAVIYKTKDFVMLVTVNVHNIPVLVNKETVVKLRNSFELSMNTERLLKVAYSAYPP